ncbi:hypothetical protein SCLCIDRAFT_145503 [Scleroderma citrinum Foug A]|uniref:Uncharacterized protein n=1 Tax=Scleroderma citrinum Foug A TaxID=1036808 RepID=A0A0C3D2T2_9AGAM|nr:hypothetical protein SCLCIDRAFT_145503 [Scleroderma citrinum Foug A]
MVCISFHSLITELLNNNIWKLGPFGPFDVWVLTTYEDYVITLPNSDFVPEPHVFQENCIEPLCDGRFGLIDCFQSPQLYAGLYAWAGCVPRQAAYRDDPVWSMMWWDISQLSSDFVLEKGSSFELGRIHKMKWEWLETVYKHLDERGQRWLKESPKYNGLLRLDAWMRSCHQCLMLLKVCSFFLLFCEVRTLGVFQIRMSRVWGSGMAQKAWSLEDVISNMLAECSPFHQ